MKKSKWVHSGTLDNKPSKREVLHSRFARKAAAEGIVLLKNEGILPLGSSWPIALLGNGARKTVKGGIGSGDVNSRENISIYRGLKEAGVVIVSEDWLEDYDNRYEDARAQWKKKILDDVKTVDNPFDAYASNPFEFPQGRPVSSDDVDGALAVVYVVSRISGEGKDRRRTAGDYYLSEREKDDILYLNELDLPIVLILNAGGAVELTGLLEQAGNIRAVLNMSQLGQEGGHAVSDVLLGQEVPSGKLTSTWAKHYEDYPFAESFGYLNGDLEKEEYKEGIYVGYRYFDSFQVKPLFPFGYGLSYTSFELEFQDLKVEHTNIGLDILVKNTGDSYAGKEVVQSYITLPRTGMEKEYHRLAGFAKTDVIQPQKTQSVHITIAQKQLASYSEEMHAWIIEKGIYGVWIGEHSASLKLAALINVSESAVIERTNAVFQPKEVFQELRMGEAESAEEAAWLIKAGRQNIPEFSYVPQQEEKREYQQQYADTEVVEKLIPLLYGNITQGTSTLGSSGVRVPGSAGETTEQLWETDGIPSLIMADGPAGLRLRQSYEVDQASDTVYGMGVLGAVDNGYLESMEYHENADLYYQYCTAFPVGTALAQTWNLPLMEEFGEAIASEMQEFHVNLWLAPGMNIHRNPLCGRNFEYYSEDPLLTGMIAAAVTRGVQSKKGCGVTLKHLACNNQEDNRMGVDACVSERALREIYFRGFEIAVKSSKPAAIMSSYNLINGIHAANHQNMCTALVRGEWGFDGIIMSDWNTTVPEDGSIPYKCIDAGNDLIMPGSQKDDHNIREALERGILSEESLRICAGRILALVQRLGS